MNEKINTPFDYIKQLCESELDLKYGHRKGKQRFLCHDCKRTYMHSTNAIMSTSHYNHPRLF